MTNPTHPKTAVIVIVNAFLNQWTTTYNQYIQELDRVNGQIQWTPEAIQTLDTIHDTLIQNINDELKYYDLNTRTSLNRLSGNLTQSSTEPVPDTYDYYYATSPEFRDSLQKAEDRFNNLLSQDMLIDVSHTTYIKDMIRNTIHVGSNIVYIGSYNSGNLNVGTVASIDYDKNKVVVPDEKYPINADEVVVYD